HQPPLGQEGDGLVDRAGLLDGCLAVPLVEDNAHRGQGGPDVVEDPVRGPAAGGGHVVGTLVGSGQLGHVLPGVAALGDVTTGAPGQQALPQRADLPAGVIDVVLPADPVPGTGQHPGQGVAVTPPPAVADVDRPGGIGRDELDLDPLTVTHVGSRVALLALGQQFGQRVVQPAVVEREVDEAGPGDL